MNHHVFSNCRKDRSSVYPPQQLKHTSPSECPPNTFPSCAAFPNHLTCLKKSMHLQRLTLELMVCHHYYKTRCYLYWAYMTEHEGNVTNPFLNFIRIWQNYLIYWIEANRYFYENYVRTNDEWFKAFWDPWSKAGNPSQRETVKIE